MADDPMHWEPDQAMGLRALRDWLMPLTDWGLRQHAPQTADVNRSWESQLVPPRGKEWWMFRREESTFKMPNDWYVTSTVKGLDDNARYRRMGKLVQQGWPGYEGTMFAARFPVSTADVCRLARLPR